MTRITLWLARHQLKSRKPEVRLRALQKLRAALHNAVLSLDDSITIALLDHTLTDPESEIRCVAAATLGDLRDARTLPPLLRALRDRAEPVQEAAIQSLKRLEDPEATAALVQKLLHGSPTIQWRAAQALKALNWQPHSDEEKICACIAAGELERLIPFGAAAVKPLAAILHDPASEKRVAAVNVLGSLNEPSGLKSLQFALRDADPLVRTAAGYALAQSSARPAVPALIAALKDRERNVRLAAALSLGKHGDPQCVPALIQLLNDREWEVRSAALESLGRLGDERALVPVTQHLEDSDQEVRESAADALGRVGDESAVEQLVLTMVDAHSGVRQAAARALAKIDPGWEKSERVQRLLPRLQTLMKNRDAGVQSAAAGLLRRLQPAPTPGIATTAAPDEAELKQRNLTNLLLALLGRTELHLRLAAIEAIGELHLAAGAEYLKPLESDTDERIRCAAQTALNALAAGSSKVTFLATAPATAPTAPVSGVEDVLLFTPFGDVLHESRCRDARGWRRLFNRTTAQAQTLARIRALGEFSRLVIATGNSRVVVQLLDEGGVMLRLPPEPPLPAPAHAPAPLPGATMKAQLTEWLRVTPSGRGVLMRGLRFADQTIVCDADSRDISAAALEEVFRAVAETFGMLQQEKLPSSRLFWACARAGLHCVSREDGTILGAFATAKNDAADLAELHRQLEEFQSLPTV